MLTDTYIINKLGRVVRGGAGSGHFDHEGRPGKIGGSLPSGESQGVAADGGGGIVNQDDFVELNEESIEEKYRILYRDYYDDELDGNELEAVETYTSGFIFPGESLDINELARTGKLPDAGEQDIQDLQEKITLLQRTLDEGPGLIEDTTLWRGIRGDFLREQLEQGNYEVGDTLVDRGFTSTSFDKSVIEEFGEGGVELKILAPAGTSGLYLEPITTVGGEEEFLLGQNTEMEITEISTEENRFFVTAIVR